MIEHDVHLAYCRPTQFPQNSYADDKHTGWPKKAIGQWRCRLECFVSQQGEQIEHLMQKLQHVSYFRQ